MIYALLFYRFFLIGLLAVGGGATTIPFLFDLSAQYHWFSSNELMNMIAVSEATPGPVGINMSTFAGFKVNGILGGIVATLGIITPSLIIIILLSKLFGRLSCHINLDEIFKTLQPAVLALIINATIEITWLGVQNLISSCILTVLLFCMFYFKKSPIFYILLSGIIGYCLQL